MAAIIKRGGTYYAKFRDATGTQILRTTRTSNPKDALRIADAMEQAARGTTADAVAASVEQLRNLASLKSTPSLSDVLDTWSADKSLTIARGTMLKYQGVADLLRTHYPKRDLSTITPRDLDALRLTLASKMSVATVNNHIKIIRSFFAYATKKGYLSSSPAASLDYVKKTNTTRDLDAKRPFTSAEITRLLSILTPDAWTLRLSVPLPEWRGIILFGLYTAQRLGDIAKLTLSSINLTKQTLHLRTQKTGKTLNIPLATPLLDYLTQYLQTDHDATSPALFPHATHAARNGHVATLSRQFQLILALAGLTPKRRAEKTRAEGDTTRHTSALSYHSLRHTATTWLYEAGVPRAVVMELVGHDSISMSQHYTHIGQDALKAAVAKLSTPKKL